jgi:poly-gamma-glutamate capsule biosynthesis protein CapA/YwtB (metallophosphatase superfamily)
MALSLLLTGDSILQRRLNSRDDAELRPLFDKVRAADVAFTNLEGLANDYRGDPALESGGSHFGAPAWVLDELVAAGFDLFAAATNHALDYSISGLVRTIEALEARGLSFAGVGRNLEDARRPCYHTSPAGTVAMISCCSTFARGNEAGAQRPDLPGRPGLNPLHVDTVHEVTEQQLAVLREVAQQLGLEADRQQKIKSGFAFPLADPALFPLGDLKFKSANRPQVRTTPNAKDVAAMVRWIEEARGLADLVLVSLHAHEQLGSKEVPAEFMGAFAREMIDAGADLVVGHGPHLLRGLELYKGKPIFYSLGNFIFQNETVEWLPPPAYEGLKLSDDDTPGDWGWGRSAGGKHGHAANPVFYRSAVAECRYADKRLKEVVLHPVDLGFAKPIGQRGRPMLAGDEVSQQVLGWLQRVSKPFGTDIRVEGNKGVIAL